MKKLLRILFLLIIGLIIALFLLPFLFKGELIKAVLDQVNEKVSAEVEVEDVNLSFFSDFPQISIQLVNPKIQGEGRFENVTLLNASDINLTTNFKSLIKSKEGIEIKSIEINDPILNIIKEKDGTSNYDIVESSEEGNNESSIFGEIDSYKIKNGKLNYTDAQSNNVVTISQLDHSGTGAFSNNNFLLDTETSIQDMNLNGGGITYLSGADISAEVDVDVDLLKKTYTLKQNSIKINDLDVSLIGTVKEIMDGYDLDLKIDAPNNNVASILSMIPIQMKRGISDITSTGISTISGDIKGVYNSEKDLKPLIDIKMKVDNGEVKYASSPFPIEDIQLDMGITADNATWNDLTIDIKEMNILVAEDRMTGKIKINNAYTSPSIVGLMNGRIDFAKLGQAIPLEGSQLRSGILESKLSFNATSEAIQNADYNNIEFDGDFNMSNVDMDYEAYPIKIASLKGKASPRKLEIDTEDILIGKSDFTGNVNIENPLAYLTDQGNSKVDLDLKSDKLWLEELQSFSEGQETEDTSSVNMDLYKNQNLTFNYEAKEVAYTDQDIKGLKVEGQLAEEKLKINRGQVISEDNAITYRGEFDNIIDYVFEEEKLTGKVYVNSDEMDLNKYMTTNSSNETTEAFLIPKNLDLDIYPEISQVKYEDHLLSNIDGKVNIEDGIAYLTDGHAKFMSGNLDLDGKYDTNDPDNPLFDIKYKMNGLKFNRLFEKSETFRTLAPIANFIEGVFNSTLVMSGPLTKEMMPDFMKVTASGFMETLEGKVAGFEPLEKLGNSLGVDKIKQWQIQDSKNWFDVKDGFVILKPHDHQVDDMVFTVGGKHSIDQELDYVINAKIPREKLSKDKLGKNLEYGMDFLESEAGKRGVNIDLGDMIYLDIFLTGSIKSPKIKVIPVGSGGKTLKEVVKDEVNDRLNVLKDTVRQEVNQKTEEIKDTVAKVVTKKTEEITDKAKDKANEEIEKKKDKLREKLGNKIDSTITNVITDSAETKVRQKAEDILGDKAKGEIDSIKSKIKDWNPFKKKN